MTDKLSLRDMCFLALMGALMLASQVAMAALPNIHIVALLIIITTLCFSWRALFSVALFVLREGLISGAHGLFFGAMTAIPYLFIGGWEAAVSYWISGIPFDLLHCAGNFVVTLILLNPLLKLTRKLI